MRYVKILIVALAFSLSMLFFVQNTAALTTSIGLELNLLVARFVSVPLPMYLLVLLAFLLGVVFSLAFLVVDRVRLALELKALRKQYAALEDEVLSLRTLPLNQPSNQPASQPTHPPYSNGV